MTGTEGDLARQNNRPLVMWLAAVAALVFVMVLLGGLTRLTESGLSMVDWHPVTGWLPPLTDTGWDAEFTKYKATPEFIKKNSFFSVEDFKQIFWLEYLHRLLGRLIGVAFALPFFWFLWRGSVARSLKPKLWFALFLGALQGLMGWYMVKSGLIDRPAVSQYRLAAHLVLAVSIYGYLLWLIQDMRVIKHSRPGGKLNTLALIVMVAVFLQIVSGAFVAGIDAGVIYNTWPLIDGAFIPSGIYSDPPFVPAIFEDYRVVQFNHRMLAYIVLGLVGWLWSTRTPRTVWIQALAIMVGVQIILGILTLVMSVPIVIAVLHQAGALLLFTFSLLVLHQREPAE